jgi:hypothetical protein
MRTAGPPTPEREVEKPQTILLFSFDVLGFTQTAG